MDIHVRRIDHPAQSKRTFLYCESLPEWVILWKHLGHECPGYINTFSGSSLYANISAREEPSRNPHFATAQTPKLLNCSEDERLISVLAFRSDRT